MSIASSPCLVNQSHQAAAASSSQAQVFPKISSQVSSSQAQSQKVSIPSSGDAEDPARSFLKNM